MDENSSDCRSCWHFLSDCEEAGIGVSDEAPGCEACMVARRSSSVSGRSIFSCGRLEEDFPILGSEPNITEHRELKLVIINSPFPGVSKAGLLAKQEDHDTKLQGSRITIGHQKLYFKNKTSRL